MKTHMTIKMALLAVLGLGFIGLTGSTAMADEHGRFERGRVVDVRGGEFRHGDFDRHDRFGRWDDRRPDCRPVMVCPPPIRPVCPPPVICRPIRTIGGGVTVTTSTVTVIVNW